MDNEKISPEIAELTDEDLDAVAGGISKAEISRAQSEALAEGRTVMLYSGNLLCLHNHKYKWARSCEESGGKTKYFDIKCYSCYKVWPDKETTGVDGDKVYIIN